MGFFDWLSLGIDFIPGIGELKAILELLSGKDSITQEDLNAWDRATCAVSLLPVIGWLSKLSKASKAAKHAKKFKVLFTLVDKANKANDKIDKINLIRQIIDDTTLTCNDPDQDYDDNYNEYENKYLKSIDEISDEVIDGFWGNGSERRRRLEEAGYDYQEVQDEVNRKLYD